MPKTALSAQEWRLRLHSYAEDTLLFDRGQKSQQGSHWARGLEKQGTRWSHQLMSLGHPFSAAVGTTRRYHVVD